MSSLLGTGILKQAEDLIFQNFDTWKREIVVWKTPIKTIVSTNPVQHNFAYGSNNPTFEETFTPVSGVFNADIVYVDSLAQQKVDQSTFQNNLNAPQPKGEVRLTLDETGRNFLISGSNERITLDGKSFKINSDERVHRIYQKYLYDIWLERIK